MECGAGHVLVPGAHHHLVYAPGGGLPGLAEAAGHPGEVLQLQGDVFQDVARPRAFTHPLEEAATLADAATVLDQGGEPFREAFVEAGKGVGGAVFQFPDVHPGFEDGAVGPDVGPAQGQYLDEFDVFLAHEVGRCQGAGTVKARHLFSARMP